MGYKRAGCEVIAANEIDPSMAHHYKQNLHPRYYYLCPIRDLVTMELPRELFGIDILDGSPPCSTFSLSGNRERSWGIEKHFREGQAVQVLDDLFFDYLDLVERLSPKVAIAENVQGMLFGNAKGYVKAIMARFRELNYRPQIFLVNAADCGVPQKRKRIFFCALRSDIDMPPLRLAPVHKWISAGDATRDVQDLTDEEIDNTKPAPLDLKYWPKTKQGRIYTHYILRYENRNANWNHRRLNGASPSCTLCASHATYLHWRECRKLSYREWKRLGSFPDDYRAKTDSIGKYIIGMSVPPKMTETVARAVCEQWL
jgi:DNA (cytosine-5)-methyltransferase 1